MKKIIAFMIAFLTINTFAGVTVNVSGNGATCSNSSSATNLNVSCRPNTNDCNVSAGLLFDNNSETGAPEKTWNGSPYGQSVSFTYSLNSSHSYQLNVYSSCKTIEVYSVTSSTDGHGALSFNSSSAKPGAKITVTIYPDEGYELNSISSSDVTLSGSGNTRSFTMPKKDVVVRATFKVKSVPVNTDCQNCSIESPKNVAFGESFTFRITPEENYEDPSVYGVYAVCEDDSTGDDFYYPLSFSDVSGKKDTYKATMLNDGVCSEVTIEASADEIFYTVDKATQTGVDEIGSLTIKNSSDEIVSSAPAGDELYVSTILKSDYYEVDSVWYCTSSSCSGSARTKIESSFGKYTFTMPKSNVWVGAEFKRVVFDISTTIRPEGAGTATIPSSGSVGKTIEFTVAPNKGYEVGSVAYSESCSGAKCNFITSQTVTPNDKGTYSFEMPSYSVDVNVAFKLATYTVTTSVEKVDGVVPGTVTLATTSGKMNDKITYSVNSNAGFKVKDFYVVTTKGEGVRTSCGNNYAACSFTMPGENAIVNAVFEYAPLTIVREVSPANSGTLNAPSSKKMNESVEFSLSPKAGYDAKGVSIEKNAGGSVEPDCNADYSSCSFTMPNEAVKIMALFEPKVYKITYEQTENGTFTVSADECAMGSTFTVSWKPDEGYDAVVTVKAGDETLSYAGYGYHYYSYKMPASDVNVSVEFVPAEYALYLNNTKKGSYDVSKETGIHLGDEIIITTKPDEGYEVSQIDILSASSTAKAIEDATDESPLPYSLKKIAENQYSFIMPAATIPIAVRFAPIEYAIRTEGHATIRTFGAVNGAFAEISTATHLSDRGTQNAVMIGAKANEGYEITGMSAVELTTGTPIAEADLSLERLTEEDLLDTLKKGTEMLGAAFEADRAFAIAMPADSVLITIETKAIAYDIAVASMENGSVEVVSGAKDSVGEEVSLKAVPSVGYEIDFLKVVRTDTEEEIATSKNGSEYSFVMPASDVLISGAFKEVPSSSSARSSSSVVSSSSSKNVIASSSSAKQSSSSSAKVTSSSSSKAKSSSSSAKAKSSSSSAKAKSSSSKGSKDAIVAMAQLSQFSVTTIGRDVQIAGAKVGAPLAILDMQGRVMTSGHVESANFSLAVARTGAFMVCIGNETRIVRVK